MDLVALVWFWFGLLVLDIVVRALAVTSSRVLCALSTLGPSQYVRVV